MWWLVALSFGALVGSILSTIFRPLFEGLYLRYIDPIITGAALFIPNPVHRIETLRGLDLVRKSMQSGTSPTIPPSTICTAPAGTFIKIHYLFEGRQLVTYVEYDKREARKKRTLVAITGEEEIVLPIDPALNVRITPQVLNVDKIEIREPKRVTFAPDVESRC